MKKIHQRHGSYGWNRGNNTISEQLKPKSATGGFQKYCHFKIMSIFYKFNIRKLGPSPLTAIQVTMEPKHHDAFY